MLACTDAAFDGPMILFQDVIKILHRSVLAVLLQHTLVFELQNRRRVSGMLVGVDDSRRRMMRFAQRFGQEALCCGSDATLPSWHTRLRKGGGTGAAEFVQRVSNPKDPLYRHYITPPEFASRFSGERGLWGRQRAALAETKILRNSSLTIIRLTARNGQNRTLGNENGPEGPKFYAFHPPVLPPDVIAGEVD